ncbi:hypothetical protein DQ04_06831020 [Trypanosoma grayi]|uniref:hypothetical protein n=1 Tax=Trypanosoma grayi TaxID=71804 RepID=UPI0004F49D9A|nr:hypothetical protein DQ04_06831020 [Trypanosoma grayi]KEG08600.1 hypothetical protein DQ04_06831020 [Trypanosoma grayi]
MARARFVRTSLVATHLSVGALGPRPGAPAGTDGGCFAQALLLPCRWKGDYGFNVFHNSNPQHGGSYARHERRMRDEEVEDFLRSVKGWVAVDDCVAGSRTAVRCATSSKVGGCNSGDMPRGGDAEEGPAPLTIFTGEEAIKREFVFQTFRDAYLFMGRFWAFCYGSDKYPHVTWEGTRVTVYLYSPSFRGLSKREARLAAFLNDQYNMFKKSKRQQQQIVNGVVKQARVEEMVGDRVAGVLQRREAERRRPLAEKAGSPTATWADLIPDSSAGGNLP